MCSNYMFSTVAATAKHSSTELLSAAQRYAIAYPELCCVHLHDLACGIMYKRAQTTFVMNNNWSTMPHTCVAKRDKKAEIMLKYR